MKLDVYKSGDGYCVSLFDNLNNETILDSASSILEANRIKQYMCKVMRDQIEKEDDTFEVTVLGETTTITGTIPVEIIPADEKTTLNEITIMYNRMKKDLSDEGLEIEAVV
jgi:hypothetical protein